MITVGEVLAFAIGICLGAGVALKWVERTFNLTWKD